MHSHFTYSKRRKGERVEGKEGVRVGGKDEGREEEKKGGKRANEWRDRYNTEAIALAVC